MHHRAFSAQYSGRCAADCGDRIEVGDPVAYTDDDELMHHGCAEREESHTTAQPGDRPCPSCWTVHRGECL